MSILISQYKSIAQVNEDALRQMEFAHENFKIEVLLCVNLLACLHYYVNVK